MKIFRVTSGGGYHDIFIDNEDYHLVLGKKVYVRFTYTNGKKIRPNSVRYIDRNGDEVKLHRMIMQAKQNQQIDHIDGNPLNNCKSNLRVATTAQNSRNRKIHITNKSGFKGVSYNKEKEKWASGIMVAGKSIYLGYFDNPEAAHKAYCEAAVKYHGEFARFS